MKIIKEISEINDIHNWFIVDVGYSNSRKSCGVLLVKNDKYTNENLEDITFSELKKRFQKFHTACNNAKIGLILEAPLSIAFDKKDGSPLGRKDIEKEKSITRYWYYGAGATVTLGALEFIDRIKSSLTDNSIYLFEGFVSFKNNEDDGSKKDEHYKDAELLYNAIKDVELYEKTVIPKYEETYRFIGEYLNLEMIGIPPIVKVTQKNEKYRQNEIFMIKS